MGAGLPELAEAILAVLTELLLLLDNKDYLLLNDDEDCLLLSNARDKLVL